MFSQTSIGTDHTQRATAAAREHAAEGARAMLQRTMRDRQDDEPCFQFRRRGSSGEGGDLVVRRSGEEAAPCLAESDVREQTWHLLIFAYTLHLVQAIEFQFEFDDPPSTVDRRQINY